MLFVCPDIHKQNWRLSEQPVQVCTCGTMMVAVSDQDAISIYTAQEVALHDAIRGSLAGLPDRLIDFDLYADRETLPMMPAVTGEPHVE